METKIVKYRTNINKYFRILVMLLVISIGAGGISAKAADTDTPEGKVAYIQDQYSAGNNTVKAKIESALRARAGTSAEDIYKVTVNSQEYKFTSVKLTSVFKAVRTVVENAQEEEANAVTDAKNGVDELNDSFNVKADIAGASDSLSGLEDIVRIIVGIIAYVVIGGMALFTSLDVLYITTPMFRSKMDDIAHSSGRVVSNEGKKSGETKVRWITDEAVYAVKVAEVGSGKSALSTYLGARVKAYIATAIVIYMLISGNISIITKIALNAVSGVLKVLEQLGS